jgi:hypothetical protein
LSELDVKQVPATRLLEALDTPEGPAKIFYRQGHNRYIAEHGECRWVVTLHDLVILNPTKYLDDGPSSRERSEVEALSQRAQISRPPRVQRRYRGDWFTRARQKANREEAEMAAAFRRLEQNVAPPYAVVLSEPFRRPQGDTGVPGPGLQPVLVLSQQIREQEAAETPFWKRPTRDD